MWVGGGLANILLPSIFCDSAEELDGAIRINDVQALAPKSTR